LIGADPVMKMRTRPPIRARNVEKIRWLYVVGGEREVVINCGEEREVVVYCCMRLCRGISETIHNTQHTNTKRKKKEKKREITLIKPPNNKSIN
jgi:hypothetical protein